ncbi:hypothetical protein [uncultured Bacteroides sp.]|uniref:hypothetical protein n=1 Tax=uncultured Bacteroides sp. TaxID=162156 RepID=UPI00260580A8|nr:hypothetical protein [uncultured Bacteroides sp.]
MKVDLDLDEMFYLLEACLRGSHLRSMTIRRFVDEWYGLFTTKQRCELYKWILRLIYNDDFKPLPRCCGQDIVFMARYNPDNQYRVTVSDGTKTETVEAFKLDGRYWVKSNRCCAEECITKIEKI